MKNALYISGLSLSLLAGCGAAYPSRPVDFAYLTGSNGLEYAEEGQVLADIEERTMDVAVARFLRDPDAGETLVILSDEQVTLPSGFTAYTARDIVLTLDGETLTFVDGRATMDSGQVIWAYQNYALEHSSTGGFYTYGKFSTPTEGEAIDTEGFFALGFQTNPDDIVALSGNTTYQGSYFGFGQRLDEDGGVIDGELKTIGAMTIEADFDSSRVSGQLNGFLDPDGADTPYTMIFVDAAIAGNGFAAAPDMICAVAATCTSNTSLGGTFFGPGAVEISGVIGFDETIRFGGETTQFVGAAGFSSTNDPPEVVPAED